MQIITLILVLGLAPWILGLPWTKVTKKSRCSVVAAYGIGYFVELALFHVVTFIGTVTYTLFHAIVIVFSLVLFLSTVCSLYYSFHYKLFLSKHNKEKWKIYTWFEWMLFLVFIASLAIQIIRGFTYDITYMSFDDAVYTAYAKDAVESNYIGIVDPYIGEGGFLDNLRAIQTSLVFPAYLSVVSGVSIASIEHTVQYIQSIVLAYSIYIYMADELFEKRENKLFFISFVSLFYIFGYHSHYSLTFRLLGPNYQGKAVLAVSLTPLIFNFWTRMLSEPYQWKAGLLLFLYSLAAVSLTLWGAGTMLVIVAIPIVLSLFRKGRQWKYLLYILWGCIAPLGFVGYYLLCRYAV